MQDVRIFSQKQKSRELCGRIPVDSVSSTIRTGSRFGVIEFHTCLLVCIKYLITFTFQLNLQEVLPSAIFWTSRGHGWRPFPPVRAFNFYRA